MYGLHLLGLIIVLVSSKPLTRPFSSEKTFGKKEDYIQYFLYTTLYCADYCNWNILHLTYYTFLYIRCQSSTIKLKPRAL